MPCKQSNWTMRVAIREFPHLDCRAIAFSLSILSHPFALSSFLLQVLLPSPLRALRFLGLTPMSRGLTRHCIDAVHIELINVIFGRMVILAFCFRLFEGTHALYQFSAFGIVRRAFEIV